ncbi:peptidoglycan-binding domain-containing protein [Streptomyces sp. RerS4]|uniref:peptidoglycan-binding domain-containing protein n=1 Tax=Streptomyces sp. RerS4 TaxID=2942449 RepID=UPI00201BE41E|nr:peptidoglycan-binding domain-containing protein [Streptomyces sp. RerS4]UQX00986.1 peptidoglycan-binding protein [Streptomyces sp. RerS4]
MAGGAYGSAAFPAEEPTSVLPAVPGGADTPAYGIPVPPPADRTVRLRAVPAAQAYTPAAGVGAKQRSRLLPGIAAAVVAAAAVGLGVVLFSGSGSDDTAMADANPSAPAAAAEASASPSASTDGAPQSPSASVTASPSASAASRSPSPSASASRSSAPPTPTPSASAGRSASPKPPPPPPAQAPTLRYGDSGAEVQELQRLLADRGLYRGRQDGRFGRSTRSAVEDFQLESEVYEDPWGVYGPATRRALEG